MSTFVGVLVVASATPKARAVEATRENCANALTDLGLPTEPYAFDEGWLGDTHVFGDVECESKRGHLYIARGRDVIVEDGYFGTEALTARDAVVQAQREATKEADEARDARIAEARADHSEQVAQLDADAQRQLREIREREIPEAVAEAAAALQAEREEEERQKQEATAERAAAAAARKAERAAERRAAEVEERRKGFHCLSGWSGAHRSVVDMVESRLNDPGSFDHEETRVAPVEDGRHQFFMRYRARNGFGALVTGMAHGTYGHVDCEDVEITEIQ